MKHTYRPFFIVSLNGWFQSSGTVVGGVRRITQAEALAYYDAMRPLPPVVEVVKTVQVVRFCGACEEGLCGK